MLGRTMLKYKSVGSFVLRVCTLLITGIVVSGKGEMVSNTSLFTWDYMKDLYGDIDYEKLVHEHELIYPGGSSCDFDRVMANELTQRIHGYDVHKCVCVDRCHYYYRCCATNPISYLPLNRKVITLLLNEEESVNLGLAVISDCPTGRETKQKCENDNIFLPVTSEATHLVYKNIFCAFCYESRNNSFAEFEPVLVCRDTINSGKSLFHRTSDGECTVAYRVTELAHVKEMIIDALHTTDITTVDRCNVTGLWTLYDEDIEWGCKHLKNEYKRFKNVFCYICNPSIQSVTSSLQYGPDACSDMYTGPVAIGVRSKCADMGTSRRLFPYKNIFCMACASMNNTWIYKNYTVFLTTAKNFIHPLMPSFITFIVEFDGIIFTQESMQDTLLSFVRVIQSQFNNSRYEREDQPSSVNISLLEIFLPDILAGVVDVCGEKQLCYTRDIRKENVSLMSHGQLCKTCKCNKGCALEESKFCCINQLAHEDIYSCQKSRAFLEFNPNPGIAEDSKTYRTVNKCMRVKTNAEKGQDCSMNTGDILSRIPVRFLNETYQNMYCLLCNTILSEVSLLLIPRTIRVSVAVVCPTYMEGFLAGSLQSVLRTVKTYNCSVRFIIPIGSHACFSIPGDHRSPVDCFENKQWTLIRQGKHNNLFCRKREHVMPILPYLSLNTDLYEDCVTYGILGCFTSNSKLTKALLCKGIPMMPRCQMSARYFKKLVGKVNNYRELFTLSRDELAKIQIALTLNTTCFGSERTMDCSGVSCFGDRIIQNDRCVHLIDSLRNESYYMAFHLVSYKKSDSMVKNVTVPGIENVHNKQHTNKTCDELKNAAATIISNLAENWWIECAIFISSDFCFKNMSAMGNIDERTCNGDVENIAVLIQIHISYSRHRTELENQLVNFAEDLEYNSLKFSESLCMQRVYSGCCFPSGLERENTSTELRKSVVCPLIEVNVDNVECKEQIMEIRIDNKSPSVSIPKSSIYVESETVIKVCRDDHESMLKIKKSNLEQISQPLIRTVYDLFSLGANIMSMLSLLMVIITYVLFRSLLTIPGWNNIILSVSLLFAQILLQYSAAVDGNSKFHNCLAIGILLHYTWLATFFAMNVCSFHMYYVFSSKALTISDSNTKRTLLKYIAWVVVMPIIIIAAVIGINMASSNCLGYGNTVCFLDTVYDVAFGFISPACLIFVSNFAFFLITFCKIHRSPTLQSNMEGRRDLVIYLKLCTITGLAWPLLLVDAILELSWFSFIAVTVNALQGFFICLAFVCNKRVLNLYIGSLRRDSSSQTTTKGSQIVSRSNTIRSRSLKLKKYND